MWGEFENYYDEDLACSLAEAYQNGSHEDRELFNLLLASIAPLVGMVSRNVVGISLVNENIDVLCCEALEDVYEIFSRSEVPTRTPKNFTAFLYTSIRRSFMETINRSKEVVYNCWKKCIDLEDLSQRSLPSFYGIENKLFLEQILSLTESIVHEDIRFDGKDREACKYIASCILGNNSASVSTARARFRLTKEKFQRLVQYVEILTKSTFDAVKRLDENY